MEGKQEEDSGKEVRREQPLRRRVGRRGECPGSQIEKVFQKGGQSANTKNWCVNL